MAIFKVNEISDLKQVMIDKINEKLPDFKASEQFPNIGELKAIDTHPFAHVFNNKGDRAGIFPAISVAATNRNENLITLAYSEEAIEITQEDLDRFKDTSVLNKSRITPTSTLDAIQTEFDTKAGAGLKLFAVLRSVNMNENAMIDIWAHEDPIKSKLFNIVFSILRDSDKEFSNKPFEFRNMDISGDSDAEYSYQFGPPALYGARITVTVNRSFDEYVIDSSVLALEDAIVDIDNVDTIGL